MNRYLIILFLTCFINSIAQKRPIFKCFRCQRYKINNTLSSELKTSTTHFPDTGNITAYTHPLY